MCCHFHTAVNNLPRKIAKAQSKRDIVIRLSENRADNSGNAMARLRSRGRISLSRSFPEIDFTDVISSIPPIMRSMVDFPQPLGPKKGNKLSVFYMQRKDF